MQTVRINGQTVSLGKRIGKGGEGEVFAINDRPEQAVKIYDTKLRISREGKVRAMVAGSIARSTDLAAFPAEIVTDLRGNFTGFVMRLISGYSPIHELYSPKSRKHTFPKADYRFLIRAALNIARAVGKVHQTGCVIGDFNHSGVLVANDATVALIDADSFQFNLNGRSFPCVVGVPDFTPPELHGVNLATVSRTKAHDNFGLAVAIFHLLAMGRHPYAGRYAGADLSLSDAIAQNRFAFSIMRSSQTQTSPPPGSLTIKDFPSSIGQAFEAAFGLRPADRPDASAWVHLLKGFEDVLSHCSVVPTHYYPSASGSCVWCRLASQSNVDMFPPHFGAGGAIPSGGPFDIERIWASIQSAALPPPTDVVPKWTGDLGPFNSAVAKAKRAAFGRKMVGVLALVGAIFGFVIAEAANIVWIGLGIFGLFRVFGTSVEKEPFLQAYADADERARQAAYAYLQRIGATELYAVRDDLEKWVTTYRKLDSDLARELSKLKTTRKARQLYSFLDRFRIRRAKIAGIGPAKTATLTSFGIETAADVTAHAVRAVPGFGEAMTDKMVDWRRSHEVKFRYNPSPNSSDVQAENAVRMASATKRADLQSKIRSGLVAIQSGSQRLKTRTGDVDQSLMRALGERAKAVRDLKNLGIPTPASSPISASAKTQPTTAPARAASTPRASSNAMVPSCPQCGATMRRRTARRGRRAGHQFWGCSRYPSCKGTRN